MSLLLYVGERQAVIVISRDTCVTYIKIVLDKVVPLWIVKHWKQTKVFSLKKLLSPAKSSREPSQTVRAMDSLEIEDAEIGCVYKI